MDPLTLVALIEALLKLAPEIPELIAAGETIVGLIQSGQAPTTEQQATIDAGLDAAHVKLQGLAASVTTTVTTTPTTSSAP